MKCACILHDCSLMLTTRNAFEISIAKVTINCTNDEQMTTVQVCSMYALTLFVPLTVHL